MEPRVLERLLVAREGGERVVLATLVSADGGSPRKEGAAMLVDDTGMVVGSVTIGGCADGRILHLANDMLESRAATAEIVQLALGEDDAVALGLSCGGAVRVLVEPLDFGVESVRRGFALLDPSEPNLRVIDLAQPDSFVLVREHAVGPPKLQPSLRRSLVTGRSVYVKRESAEYLIDYWGPAPHLVIVGATEVGCRLGSLAATAGYEVTLIDPRPELLIEERCPEVDQRLAGIPSELVKTIPVSGSTHFAIVIHDYKVELPVLNYLLESSAGYIGLLAGGKRRQKLYDLLIERGAAANDLDRIESPIGLDIGGDTANEIAVAVLAEIQQVRYRVD